MARNDDTFEGRLEQLESGEHRAQFDSKVRSLMTDSAATLLAGKAEPEAQVTRLLSLMEDLAKRIDRLDRKNRSIVEEIRARDRRERWRLLAIGLAAVALLLWLAAGGRARTPIDTPAVSAVAAD